MNFPDRRALPARRAWCPFSSRAMNERTRERELAERRALALKKLAKVFGTNGGDTDDGRAAHTAEKKILLEILRSTREPDVVGLVRDRLAVLSARDDSDESDEDYDVKAGEPGAGYHRRNPKPADPRDAKTVFSKQWTAAALREIAKGARSVPNATLASGAFWEKLLVTHAPELEHLTCDSGRQRESNGDEPEDDDDGDDDGDGDVWLWSRETLSRSVDSEVNLRSAIVERGYAVLPRPEFFLSETAEIRHDAWTETLSRERMDEKKTSLDDLADATDALRGAGWPPVALFAFDAAWRLVDRLFPVAAAALDVDVKDVLLEPTVFAWALSAAEEDEEKLHSKHAETMKIAASVRPELRDAARGASLRDVLVNGAEKKKKKTPVQATPAATPSRSRTATTPRRRRGATTCGRDARPAVSANRSWCASGCPSRTRRWTPGVCTSCRGPKTGCSTTRTTRTT